MSFIRGSVPLINQSPPEINDDRQPGTTVPAVTAVARGAEAGGAPLSDQAIARQLRAPGAGPARAARQLQADGTCDDAGDRQSARHDHAVQPEASSPAS